MHQNVLNVPCQRVLHLNDLPDNTLTQNSLTVSPFYLCHACHALGTLNTEVSDFDVSHLHCYKHWRVGFFFFLSLRCACMSTSHKKSPEKPFSLAPGIFVFFFHTNFRHVAARKICTQDLISFLAQAKFEFVIFLSSR